MVRMSKAIGLRVVLHGTGRRCGAVERVVLSDDGQDVAGLVACGRGVIPRRRFVPAGCICLWGEVTASVERVEKLPQEVKRREDAVGMEVTDTTGERLGWVTDVLFDESSGKVLALEISRCIVDDLIAGRIAVQDFTLRQGGVVAVLPQFHKDKEAQEECSE